MEYVLGCPSFGMASSGVNSFSAPIGEIELCRKVLRNIKSGEDSLIEIQKEYMSIFFALVEMEIDFSISCSVLEKEYRQGLEGLLTGLRREFGDIFNIKITDISKYCPIDLASFPKDVATILVAGSLINSEVEIPKKIGIKNVSNVLLSSYGEGGRVLSCRDVVLVSDHLTLGEFRPIERARVRDFDQMEVNLGLIPLPVSSIFSLSSIDKAFPNDHLDRVACLIEGKDEKLHLIVDPKIHTYKKDESQNWIIQKPEESLEDIRKVCDSLGIELHRPKKTEIPYVLNLVQFEDKRILMTGGDECVHQLISEIVGEDMVITTEVPIQLYPTFNRAGIGCIINKSLPQMVLQPNALIA